MIIFFPDTVWEKGVTFAVMFNKLIGLKSLYVSNIIHNGMALHRSGMLLCFGVNHCMLCDTDELNLKK